MANNTHNLGSGQTVPTIVMSAVPDMTKVKPTDWSVLALVDGQRDVDAICAAATMPPKEARAALERLLEFGMIEVPSSAPASTGPRAGSSAPRRPTSTPSGRARPSTSSSHPFGRNPPASSPSGARRRSSSSSNPFQRSRSNAPARSNPAMGTRPSSSSAPPLATASTPSSSSSSSGATRTPPPQRLKVAVTPAPSKAKPEQKSE
ncbi:MAG: hypothetical protein AAFS10_22975, partial [Myxococcota bacterium]